MSHASELLQEWVALEGICDSSLLDTQKQHGSSDWSPSDQSRQALPRKERTLYYNI